MKTFNLTVLEFIGCMTFVAVVFGIGPTMLSPPSVLGKQFRFNDRVWTVIRDAPNPAGASVDCMDNVRGETLMFGVPAVRVLIRQYNVEAK